MVFFSGAKLGKGVVINYGVLCLDYACEEEGEERVYLLIGRALAGFGGIWNWEVCLSYHIGVNIWGVKDLEL